MRISGLNVPVAFIAQPLGPRSVMLVLAGNLAPPITISVWMVKGGVSVGLVAGAQK